MQTSDPIRPFKGYPEFLITSLTGITGVEI